MSKSVPYFKFYTGDYLKSDMAFASPLTQFVWFRMQICMHDSEPRGYLQMAAKPMPDEVAAVRCFVTVEQYRAAIEDMEAMEWLKRKPYTGIIYCPTIIEQEEQRAGTRKRVHDHRNRGKDNEQLSETSDQTSEKKLPTDFPESETCIAKSLVDKENGNSDVTRLKRSCTEHEHEHEHDTALGISSSLPQKPKDKELPARELPPLPDPIPAAMLAAQHAAEASGALNNTDLTIEEIALASPAGIALGWTPLSIHGKTLILKPIIDAVELEAKDQGVGKHQAALWLLTRMRHITQGVMREPGWKKYWTQKRMIGFYETTEYRTLERFTGESHGSAANTRRSSKTDGNAEALRRALGESGASAGDWASAGQPGRHAGEGPEQAGSDGALHRDSRGPEPAGMHPGVQQGSGTDGKVVSFPRATTSLRWPS